MNQRIKNSLPLAVDERAKAHIKAVVTERFNTSKKRSIRQLLGGHKKLATGMLSGLIMFTILGGFVLGRNPLTMQRVLAGAIEKIESKTAQGKWMYQKTRETMEYKDGRSITTTTEMLNSTSETDLAFSADSPDDMPNSSTKATLEDGRILYQNVFFEGAMYERDTRETQKEIYGYDPYAQFGVATVESVENSPLPPGFAEAGLTNQAFETMSMKQIDDALVAAGQKPLNSPSYKSTDFPAYTMTPQEIETFMKDHGADQEFSQEAYDELYGGQDNMVTSSTVITETGEELTGEEAEAYMAEQQAQFEDFNRLRTGTVEEKKQALKSIQEKGNATLKENVEFEGRRVLALESNDGGAGNRQIMYIDPKTFEMIGEEYITDPDQFVTQGMPEGFENQIPVRVKIVYLEQRFFNEEPTFSVEGLTKIEQLYNFTGGDKQTE